MTPRETSSSPGEMEVGPEQPDQKSYHERTEVNGKEISVTWDSGYDDYTIFFPQIDLSNARKNEPGVNDQLLRITRKPEIAKQAFDFAVKKAKEVETVYDLYREVSKFSKDLPYDDEE